MNDSKTYDFSDPKALAAQIEAELQAQPVRNSENTRKLRKKYSGLLKKASPDFVLSVARALVHTYSQRSIPYELLLYHKAAFQSLGEAEIEDLGQGIRGWHAVDCFGRLLSGPAWLAGLISDEIVHKWAQSEDLWWRRAALVTTVALNMKASGGTGDTARTLAVCSMLVDDHEDMVVKALSWALRVLAPWDPASVQAFLTEYDTRLAARVKREVNNKLTTGLKNPKRKNL
jgi:3-methyladenine DNA glycosylase AlkD